MIINIIKLLVNHIYKPLYPVGAVLYLTSKCNLKCKFCEIGLANINKIFDFNELSTEQIDNVISALNKLKVRNIYITGGEPFLSKNLWYLLKQCSIHSISVDAITTNGTLLNGLDELAISSLNEAKVSKIIISLDHVVPEKHDALRGRVGLFADIESFFRSGKSDKINTTFCLSTVVTKDNYTELSDLIGWAHSVNKIKHLNFQPVCLESIFVDYQGGGGEKQAFYIERRELDSMESHLRMAQSKAESLKMSSTLPVLNTWIRSYFTYINSDVFFFDKVLNKFICSKPYNYIHINYNGDLLACTHIGPIGNIDNQNIVSQWRTAAFKYRQILNSKKYFNKCKSCFCDMAANYRISLLYSPLSNYSKFRKHVFYYINRYLDKIIK